MISKPAHFLEWRTASKRLKGGKLRPLKPARGVREGQVWLFAWPALEAELDFLHPYYVPTLPGLSHDIPQPYQMVKFPILKPWPTEPTSPLKPFWATPHPSAGRELTQPLRRVQSKPLFAWEVARCGKCSQKSSNIQHQNSMFPKIIQHPAPKFNVPKNHPTSSTKIQCSQKSSNIQHPKFTKLWSPKARPPDSTRPGCPGGMKYKDRWLGGDLPDGRVLEPAAFSALKKRAERRMVLFSSKFVGKPSKPKWRITGLV